VTLPKKALVAGIPISMTTYDDLIEVIANRPDDRATVVVVCNVHSVMSARRSPPLAAALSSAEVATPDGVPIVWGLRLTAHRDQDRVYGPELLRRAFATGDGWGHYLYGSDPQTLATLRDRLAAEYPSARVVGSSSPPFRTPTDEELAADISAIRASGADIVWVGLGMPKQELWMHQVRDQLPGVTLIGVGAAFDFVAGTKRQAPSWMQRVGLEWLFRLLQEPRRLWRRYVINNPVFVLVLARQVVVGRFRRRRTTGGV
jgi:N-acetylglucosaminyldiphosphoundecaprenol N-acetyl-beta-D-mannosaminyltransferase